MKPALASALLVIAVLGCPGERAQPPARDRIADTAPSAAPAAPDTESLRVDRIEYHLLYNYGDTSTDLVKHPDSTWNAVYRSPADSALVRVVLLGRPGATAVGTLLDLVATGDGLRQDTLVLPFDSTGQQTLSYRVLKPQGDCYSVFLRAYLHRGSLQFGERTAKVAFELQCGE